MFPTTPKKAAQWLGVDMKLPHMTGKAKRSVAGKRAFRLTEEERNHGILYTGDKSAHLRKIVQYMDVEHSMMFLPAEGKTYCNVYASALADILGCYIPRVWWTDDALKSLSKGTVPDIEYDETVSEKNANSLHNWFLTFGEYANWKVKAERTNSGRVAQAESLRDVVNAQETIGCIVGRRRDRARSGHITIVLPDKVMPSLMKEDSAPLQTQAGTKNKMFFTSDWYTSKSLDYDSVVFAEYTGKLFGQE